MTLPNLRSGSSAKTGLIHSQIVGACLFEVRHCGASRIRTQCENEAAVN